LKLIFFGRSEGKGKGGESGFQTGPTFPLLVFCCPKSLGYFYG